jgi:hypothetical protein
MRFTRQYAGSLRVVKAASKLQPRVEQRWLLLVTVTNVCPSAHQLSLHAALRNCGPTRGRQALDGSLPETVVPQVYARDRHALYARQATGEKSLLRPQR